MNYFIGDMHLGHAGSLIMDNRPFLSVEEMDDALIQNWNSRVTNRDTGFIVGDLTMKGETSAIQYLKRLNGKKVLVKGNHDRVSTETAKYYDEVTPYLEMQENGIKVIVCHYPMLFYNRQHTSAVMLYAHVHETKEYELVEKFRKEMMEQGIPSRMYNVGCMRPYMNYYPRTLTEILRANEE